MKSLQNLHFTCFVDSGKSKRTYKSLRKTYIMKPQVDRPKLTSEVKYSPRIINLIALQMFHETLLEDWSTLSPYDAV